MSEARRIDGDQAEGQATWDMANLRPEDTGLPFVVYISMKGGARHDVRVKVSPGPKVRPDLMGTYALRPFRHEGGFQLSPAFEKMLEAWVEINAGTLVSYWNGDIPYTLDAINALRPLRSAP